MNKVVGIAAACVLWATTLSSDGLSTSNAQEQDGVGLITITGTLFDVDGTPRQENCRAVIEWRSGDGRRGTGIRVRPDPDGSFDLSWIAPFGELPAGRMRVAIWSDPSEGGRPDTEVFSTQEAGIGAFSTAVVAGEFGPDLKLQEVGLGELSMAAPPFIGNLSVPAGGESTRVDVSISEPFQLGAFSSISSQPHAIVGPGEVLPLYSWAPGAEFYITFAGSTWGGKCAFNSVLSRGHSLVVDVNEEVMLTVQMTKPDLVGQRMMLLIWDESVYPGAPSVSSSPAENSIGYSLRVREALGSCSTLRNSLPDAADFGLTSVGTYVVEAYSSASLSSFHSAETFVCATGGRTVVQF